MMQQGRVSAGPDYADLHRHVGGAVHPKVLYGYLTTHGPDVGANPTEREVIHRLLCRFTTYAALKDHFATRRTRLDDYLELHKLVDPLQTPASIFFFPDTAMPEIYTLSLHDVLALSSGWPQHP